MTRLLLGLVGLFSGLVLLFPAASNAQVEYVPAEDSRVWIEGTSTARDFTCSTQKISGQARLSATAPARSAPLLESSSSPNAAASDEALDVQAHVPVRALDCGQERQNEDLYEAMDADDHPAIEFEIIKAEVIAEPDSSRNHYVLEAIGDLTIAGETRTVRIPLEGRRLDDGRLHARGTLPMKMTDFKVDPPTALLGLIRVRDDIVVHFDITAVPDSTSPGS